MKPLIMFAVVCLLSLPVFAQEAGPVVVQPGAPGRPTRTLPSSTRATLPPASPKDVEFMQHMIVHHAQAVEMTALIESRTENKEIRTLGARISRSQASEIEFMKRWLEAKDSEGRKQETAAGSESKKPQQPAGGSHTGHTQIMEGHQMPRTDAPSLTVDHGLMPGMLTAKQMEELRKAKGEEFDRLFLKGMIQHHNGALIMVKELFDTAGAGQDAELFNFATDVDSGQRAEIRVMHTMLDEKR